MKGNFLLGSFNRGKISPLGLARVGENDKASERVRLSAEVMTNWRPRVLGSMMLRPGYQYLLRQYLNKKAVHIPFIKAFDDQAIIELTENNMRVHVNDVTITRNSVSSTINNSYFNSDLTGWTDADETGATSSWATGGYMSLVGTGFKSAIRRQEVSLPSGSIGVKHALNISILQGIVTLKIGLSAGSEEHANVELTEGYHSLSFTPTANFHIELSASTKYASIVDFIEVSAGGDMLLPTVFSETDLPFIRWEQSGDVIYLSARNVHPYKIERRGVESWSIVKYLPDDGPFRPMNTTNTTITPSATSGSITLTASSSIFTEDNIGGLYKIESIGQTVSVAVTAQNQFSDPIRVTGVDTSRTFSISVSVSSFSGTIVIQRSVDEPGDWADVPGLSYTGNTTTTHDDGLDNQIIYYRIGCKTGAYTSGSATATLTFASGSNTGVVRVTAYTSGTVVTGDVLNELGGTAASSNWYEGLWSDRRGFPSDMKLYGGRMTQCGKGRVVLSESDSFEDYDEDAVGDAAPINKTIGSGPVDNFNWIFPGKKLVLGSDTREISIGSSTLDEPLTPTAFNIKYPTTYGSAPIPPVTLDSTCVFVHRSGRDILQLVYNDTAYDYGMASMTTLVPEICDPGVVRIAIQRTPDTRIHVIRSDGTIGLMVSDPGEKVECWIDDELGGNGEVEDVFVMPGTEEDRVYYSVKRVINGETVRYLERSAMESECQGGTLNKQLDSFVLYSGEATTTISYLDHLEGEEVTVWGDGRYNGAYTVTSGSITLTTAVSEAVIGLPYTALYKSSKLAYGAQMGTALTMKKRVDHVGLLLYNTHCQGIQYGQDFVNMDNLPLMKDGSLVSADTIHTSYDDVGFELNGAYETDARLCLKAVAPYPVTVLAAVLYMRTYEK